MSNLVTFSTLDRVQEELKHTDILLHRDEEEDIYLVGVEPGDLTYFPTLDLVVAKCKFIVSKLYDNTIEIERFTFQHALDFSTDFEGIEEYELKDLVKNSSEWDLFKDLMARNFDYDD